MKSKAKQSGLRLRGSRRCGPARFEARRRLVELGLKIRRHSLKLRMGPCSRRPITASSLNRLHKQAGQKTAPDQRHCVNFALATREPSTEDIAARSLGVRLANLKFGGFWRAGKLNAVRRKKGEMTASATYLTST